MAAGVFNFKVNQGETFNPSITWKDSNGSAYDITGYTAKMQVRRFEGGAMDIPTGTDGVINLLLTATETAALTADTYIYDLLLDDGSGVKTRILEGTFTVKAQVTV
jgi:hypothetical protein